MGDVVPSSYIEALAAAKTAIQSARARAVLAVNGELIHLYWTLGRLILDRQEADGWGSKVIERLASDLRREFPQMTGLSRANLHYMRAFAAAWPETESVQQLVGRLPWGHNLLLISKLDDASLRQWYAAQAIEYGWSRAVLENQIMSQLHLRQGVAPSNFAETIGLLLSTSRNERVVRYALGRSTSPLAVAGYRYTELGPAEQAILPAEHELFQVVADVVDEFDYRE